jgi:hypothetical protein
MKKYFQFILSLFFIISSPFAFAYDHIDYANDLNKAAQIIYDGVDCHTNIAGSIKMKDVLNYLQSSLDDLQKAINFADVKAKDLDVPSRKHQLYRAYLLSFNILNDSQLLEKEVFNNLYCPPNLVYRNVILSNFKDVEEHFRFGVNKKK